MYNLYRIKAVKKKQFFIQSKFKYVWSITKRSNFYLEKCWYLYYFEQNYFWWGILIKTQKKLSIRVTQKKMESRLRQKKD